MSQQCIACGALKPLDDYYRSPKMKNGYLSKCKECCRRATRAARLARLDHYQAYDRQRDKAPHRVLLRKKVLARRPAFMKAANQAVNNALRDGRLFRQPCEVCGDAKVEAHHDDYTKPLIVRWLCREHHMQRHRFGGPNYRQNDARRLGR